MAARPRQSQSRAPSPALRDDLHAAVGYWELRAFHHFAVATCETLPGSHIPSVKKCWALQVPLLALSYKPLWNQLLALSALHLVTSGHDQSELLACRANYLDATLQSYRPALGRLSEETAESACFTSILLLVDTFATLQHRPLDNYCYEPPMQWLRVTQGARAVFEASATDTDPTSSIMTIISSSNHNQGITSADRESRQRLYYLLDTFPGETPPLQGVSQAYQETVDRLSLILAAWEAGEPLLALCRRLMSFACLVPCVFLELVEQKVPRALCILGHFFAVSVCAKDMWWVGEAPFREVHAIRACLPPELQHFMDWPYQIIINPSGPPDHKG